MKKSRLYKIVATVLIAQLLSVPSISAMAESGLPELKPEFITRSITDLSAAGVQTDSDNLIPDEDQNEPETDPETDLETDPGTESDPETEPETDPEAGTEEDPGTDSEIVSDILEEQIISASGRAASYKGGNGLELASSSSARVEYTVDGKARDSISFYMERNPATNQADLPEPVVLRFEQVAGEVDFGEIRVSAGIPKSPYGPSDGLNTNEITRVRIEPESGYLKAGESLEFRICFVDQDVADGKENVNNNGKMHFLTVSGAGVEKDIPVYYGADGLYNGYSADSVGQYEGTPFKNPDTGAVYRLVGHVKLNEEDAPTLTIRHQFGVYADMTAGTDAQGTPIPLRISRLKLDPNGDFTFTNGSYERTPQMDENGMITINIKFKDEVFQKIRRQAERDKKMLLSYVLLTDLVMEYNDGYLAGGSENPLPLVYAVSYIPPSNHRPSGGGGGGGGGGSSSGSGASVSGSVVGPGMAPRVTNASAEDIGWVQKDGFWYYMNAVNTPVTDWLLGTDGRWYFLEAGGVMKTGWLSLGGKWYFLNGDGAMAVGWVQGADGKWYYLNQDGIMAVNTTTPDGYAVDQDGVWQSV